MIFYFYIYCSLMFGKFIILVKPYFVKMNTIIKTISGVFTAPFVRPIQKPIHFIPTDSVIKNTHAVIVPGYIEHDPNIFLHRRTRRRVNTI